MLLVMVSFFAVVFAANAMLVVSAYRSWTGLVVENSYVASQSFDADTDRLRKARDGISHQLHYHAGQLQLTLQLSDGIIAQANDLKIELGRPADNSQDVSFMLTPRGKNTYGVAAKLAAGIWIGKIMGNLADHREIILPVRLNVLEGS
jgi:nitrogen fixation protein FixH